jgi:hypothetical protein
MRVQVNEIATADFGNVIVVAVGATIVGSIIHTVPEGASVSKGDELGYFAFGGSTVLTLFAVRAGGGRMHVGPRAVPCCCCPFCCTCSRCIGTDVPLVNVDCVLWFRFQPGTIKFDDDLLATSALPLETLLQVCAFSRLWMRWRTQCCVLKSAFRGTTL